MDLNENDCKKLGLKLDKTVVLKRFKSFVLDGKVIGALRKFPVRDDALKKLTG